MKPMIVNALLGILIHQTNRIIVGWSNTPYPWRRLARYTIGVTAIIVSFSWGFLRSISARWDRLSPREQVAMGEDATLTLISTSLFIGVGVAGGYVIDKLLEGMNNGN